ncbi:RNA polymerase sigma factor [Sporosarcina sp. CAU 1771]
MVKEIVKHLYKKENESERIIFEMFYKRVYYTAYYIVKEHDLAQDVLQESFIKAFENLDALRDGEKLGAWLTTITTRTAIDHLQKSKYRYEIATEDEIICSIHSKEYKNVSTLETNLEEKFIRKTLLEEIDKLSPEHKAVLILQYFTDLKYTEIALALNIKLDVVKTRIHRAKSKLKEAIEQKPEMKQSILGVEV